MAASEVFGKPTTRWFGESWGAPVCDDTPHVATPVGSSCICCGALVRDGDRGLSIARLPFPELGAETVAVIFDVVHLECWVKNLTGGIAGVP